MPRKKVSRSDSLLSACFRFGPIKEDVCYTRANNFDRNQEYRSSLRQTPNSLANESPSKLVRNSKFRYSLRSSRDSGVSDLNQSISSSQSQTARVDRKPNLVSKMVAKEVSEFGSFDNSSSSLPPSSSVSSIGYQRLANGIEEELEFDLHVFFFCMAINFKLGCEESIEVYKTRLQNDNLITSERDFQEIEQLLENNIQLIMEQTSYQNLKAKTHRESTLTKLKERGAKLEQQASPMTFKRLSPVKMEYVPTMTLATLGGYIFIVCWRACSEYSKQKKARELLSYSREIKNESLVELVATLSALYIINNYDKEIRRKFDQKSELNLRNIWTLVNKNNRCSPELPIEKELQFIEKRAKKHAEAIYDWLIKYVTEEKYRKYDTNLYNLIPPFSHSSKDQQVLEKRQSLYALLGAFDLSLEETKDRDALYAELKDILKVKDSFVELIKAINCRNNQASSIDNSSLCSSNYPDSRSTFSRQESLRSDISSESLLPGHLGFFSPHRNPLGEDAFSQCSRGTSIYYADEETEAMDRSSIT